MNKSSKTRLCSECKRATEVSALRPLARTHNGRSVRYACPVCFGRVMMLRKTVREAH